MLPLIKTGGHTGNSQSPENVGFCDECDRCYRGRGHSEADRQSPENVGFCDECDRCDRCDRGRGGSNPWAGPTHTGGVVISFESMGWANGRSLVFNLVCVTGPSGLNGQ